MLDHRTLWRGKVVFPTSMVRSLETSEIGLQGIVIELSFN